MQPLVKIKKSVKDKKDDERDVGFDAGKAGFTLALGDGKKQTSAEQLVVTGITYEGQAYWRGVKKGWIVKKVNGEGISKHPRTLTFSESVKIALKNAIEKKYIITFILPKKDAEHRKRRSMSGVGARVAAKMQAEAEAALAADAEENRDEEKEQAYQAFGAAAEGGQE